MRWLLLVVLLLVPAAARAADEEVPEYSPSPPIQTIPLGDDKIVVVGRGKPAPFSGQLFDPATAMRWANWLTQYRTRLVQDVQRERELCITEVTHREELMEIEAERNKRIEDDLRERVLRVEKYNAKLNDDMNNPSFFRSVEFGLLLGVVGSSAVAVAVGLAAN